MSEQKGQKPVEKIKEDVQQARGLRVHPHLHAATGLYCFRECCS